MKATAEQPPNCCQISALTPEVLVRQFGVQYRSDDDGIMHPESIPVKHRRQFIQGHCPKKLLAQVRDAIHINHYRTEQDQTGRIKRYTDASSQPSREAGLSAGSRTYRTVHPF